MKVSAVCLGVLLSLIGSHSFSAQAVPDFSGAEVVSEDNKALQDYRLVLSSLKKINGQWRAETERRVVGSLQRKTLEVKGGHSVDEAYGFYVQQLQGAMAAREVFSCDGLKCGPSNAWANEHFELKQLYGLDKFQHYSVWLLAPGEYLSLYGIRRGNKRVYIHLETMTATDKQVLEIATTPETITRALKTEGYFAFPSEVLSQDAKALATNVHVKSLVQVLRGERLMKVTVVGHDFRAGTASKKLAASAAIAEKLKGVLITAGVSEQRLSVFAAGGFAPQGNQGANTRIVIVRD